MLVKLHLEISVFSKMDLFCKNVFSFRVSSFFLREGVSQEKILFRWSFGIMKIFSEKKNKSKII